MSALETVLSHNLFATSISVLEVLISLVGLFGGGYVGTRVGALSRMRVEDRRRLLDESVRELRSMPLPAESDLGEEAAGSLIDAMVKATNIVELLPWLDRHEWKLLSRVLPISEAMQLGVAMMAQGAAAWPMGEGEKPSSEAQRLAAIEARFRFGEFFAARVAMNSSDSEFLCALSRFESHLKYRLRPNVWRSFVLRWRGIRAWVGEIPEWTRALLSRS